MGIIQYKAFDHGDDLLVYQRKLPHWRQDGCAYFVTFRLGDSIPYEQVKEWDQVRAAWLERHPQPWTDEEWQKYNETFTKQMEEYLHAGYGKCLLKRTALREIVVGALQYFDGQRYELGNWVVMPNHVHCVVLPLKEYDLDRIAHSWKSFTAHEINKQTGQDGIVWNGESYDHIIRNGAEMARIAKYIHDNPEKAGLKRGTYAAGGSTADWQCRT